MDENNYEVLLLSALLANPEAIAVAETRKEDFLDMRMRMAFECLLSLSEGVVNPATLCQELEHREWENDIAVKFVATLVSLRTEARTDQDSIAFYASKVADRGAKRRLSPQLSGVLAQVDDPATCFDDNVAALSDVLMRAQAGSTTQRDPTSEAIIARILERASRPVAPVFSSGLDLIDQALISRGIAAEQLWVITGQYKGMKSRIAINMCVAALDQGKSVAYFGLEDNETVYTTGIMAAKFAIPKGAFHEVYRGEHPQMEAEVLEAMNWAVSLSPRWRVYDRKHGIGDPRRFAPRVRADKLKYGCDLVILDHLQLYGRTYEELAPFVNTLIDVAASCEVGLVVISQMNNQTLREGPSEVMLHTKGTGDMGALAHVGLEVYKPADCDFKANEEVMANLRINGLSGYVRPDRLLSEISLKLKVVREGRTPSTYCLFEPYSGKLLRMSLDPAHIEARD